MFALVSRAGNGWRVRFYKQFKGRGRWWVTHEVEGDWAEVRDELVGMRDLLG